jgi:pentatricopeptide repeat protein
VAAALREHGIVTVLVTCKVDRPQNSVVWGNVPIGNSGTRDFLATRSRLCDYRRYLQSLTPYLHIQLSTNHMFECKSCALRCMRAVAGDAVSMRQPLQQRLLLTPHLQQGLSRRAASTSTAQQAYPQDAFDEAEDDPIEFDEPHASSARVPTTPRTQQLSKRSKSVDQENKKSLEIELRYLKDPLKLSEHVKYTLKCEKPEKALDLCRLASKTMSCVVSWNAVIDYLMKKWKVNEALKVYNEMKKRAQFPDAYTYMMVLRGLGYKRQGTHDTPVKEENVSKAISIYTSMNAPTSRVKPNIFHTNATLNVCALALDMDALWSVAGQIPPKGPNAADRMTYTIILNAIRHSAYGKNPAGAPLEQIAARRQKAVDEGRRVWMDVIRKWRAGEVAIDEDLVASMGRLLLTSKRIEDWDNVLDLVQQTMNIERLIAPVGSPDRHTEHVPQVDIPEAPKAGEEDADEEGYTNTSAAKAFKVVKPSQPEHATSKGTRPLVWAEPGPQVLSLLVDACQQMRIPRVASSYWELLTTASQRSVEPDLENFDRQLRLFASNRASAKAAKLLREDLPAAGIEPKNSTFRIAMSACQRDMKNRLGARHHHHRRHGKGIRRPGLTSPNGIPVPGPHNQRRPKDCRRHRPNGLHSPQPPLASQLRTRAQDERGGRRARPERRLPVHANSGRRHRHAHGPLAGPTRGLPALARQTRGSREVPGFCAEARCKERSGVGATS